MHPESPSDVMSTQLLGTKRIRFEEPLPTGVLGKATTQPTCVTSPLKAALATAQTYVATLHVKLQPFLKDHIGCVLKDASTFHYKSEKYKEMCANPEYVPAICQSVVMKLQALDEVTKSPGYKTLKDKPAKEIEALQRDWATRFVLPVQDLNVRAMKKRYQLSICWLLSMAAKGFIAQAGAKGYDANAAVMDLLTMHGNDTPTPLNINAHNFLLLFKEAAGLTIIPFPTVLHNLTDMINKVNSDALAGALGDIYKNLARTMMTTTKMMGTTKATMVAVAAAAAAATAMMAAMAMTATMRTMATTATKEATATAAAAMVAVVVLAAANTLTNLIMAAAAAVTRATSQKDLAHAMAEQARSIADEALKSCTNVRTALEEARLVVLG
jgi:hypothetical protein